MFEFVSDLYDKLMKYLYPPTETLHPRMLTSIERMNRIKFHEVLPVIKPQRLSTPPPIGQDREKPEGYERTVRKKRKRKFLEGSLVGRNNSTPRRRYSSSTSCYNSYFQRHPAQSVCLGKGKTQG
jgi:hypothetical protein